MPTLTTTLLLLAPFALAAGVHASTKVARTVDDPPVAPTRALTPVPFTEVRFEDEFWAPRIETNRSVTVPYCFRKSEETGRISNFAKAGGLVPGGFEGIYYNDSDVYKIIEGAAYSLAARPDPKLDAYLDDLIATIAAAQREDGYLNTFHTLAEPENRWGNIKDKHELYCAGHLFEAAVAHHRATGKRTLLDVALKLADHIDAVFGPGKRTDPPGHQEIEIGLVRLYDLTGEERYLDLANFFLEQRGRHEGRPNYGRYAQDHLPVTEQDEPVGHAVRAMYMYCGMADVAALTNNRSYLDALDRLWRDEVDTKLYLTGGIGARRHGEAFGDDYELPNDTAYNETCAAIGNAMWNHRMNLLSGDARYADVVERVIHNGFLAGVSLDGNRFFYPNPLSSHGSYHRSPWFDCSCCPVNVVRFVPSLPGYAYARDEEGVYVNLFVQGEATVPIRGEDVTIRQETRYPWDGRVTMTVEPTTAREFSLNVRIPGWARNRPVPSDLYRYENPEVAEAWSIAVNGEPIRIDSLDDGYASIERTWSPGDTVTLNLPMPIRLVRAHEKVEADRGRVAIERGPIVYCVEAVDAGGKVRNLYLPDDLDLRTEHRPDLLGGVTVVTGTARARVRVDDGSVETRDVPFTAIPYYAWDHREAGEMAVWLPTEPELASVAPAPTLASRSKVTASHCWQGDAVEAINDQFEPSSSVDHSVPRQTFWPHRGTNEWVEMHLPEASEVSAVEVFWFDDTGVGQCRLPKSWRLLYRDGSAWSPVRSSDEFGTAKDRFNRVEFEPMTTDALRLEIQLQDEFSGGLLEWKVE